MSPNGSDEHHTANGVSVLPHPAWTQAEIALEACHIELAKADSNSEACQGDSAEDAVRRIPGASSGALSLLSFSMSRDGTSGRLRISIFGDRQA